MKILKIEIVYGKGVDLDYIVLRFRDGESLYKALIYNNNYWFMRDK
jgi:hypothetical protein